MTVWKAQEWGGMFRGIKRLTWIKYKGLMSEGHTTKSLSKGIYNYHSLPNKRSANSLHSLWEFSAFSMWVAFLTKGEDWLNWTDNEQLHIGGVIHSTKIQTGPTWKSGPPQKVDQFFRNFSGWTEPINWVLDWNFGIFRLNGSRPGSPNLGPRVVTTRPWRHCPNMGS